jgi:hypothetical protein
MARTWAARLRTIAKARQMTKPRRCLRPQAEGAVDVDPCAMLMRDRANLGEGVGSAGVDLAGLSNDDRKPLDGLERLCERAGTHSPGIIGRDGFDPA